MKRIVLCAGAFLLISFSTQAQILLSGGLSYSQNFDSLSNSPAAGSQTWTDNATPGLTGWYASRAFVSGTTSAFGPFAYPSIRIGDGSANNGSIWSFGTIGNADRALGTASSGTPKTNVFGLRVANDTGLSVGNITISYTGEQWRNGGNTATQTLAFSYQIRPTPFTSPIDTESAPFNGWIVFSGLNFLSPTVGAAAAALDGNNPANQVAFTGVVLTGVTVNPGEEIFFRWLDIDDSGNDHGFGIDNFSVDFTVPEPSTAVLGGLGFLGLVLWRRLRPAVR